MNDQIAEARNELVAALAKYRQERGISREAVARTMGVSLSTLYRWEKGMCIPKGLSKSALEKFLRKNNMGSGHFA